MEKEIINKVEKSSLKVFDLEDYFPKQSLVEIDISQWLYGGFVLKEKEFRTFLSEHDWSQYEEALVALTCTTDAILPSWAFMLVSSFLQPYAQFVTQGRKEELMKAYYQEKLAHLDFSVYQDLPVIIKGCAHKPIPEEAYVMATQKMMGYARSIMFGEACSAVPVYKRKRL